MAELDAGRVSARRVPRWLIAALVAYVALAVVYSAVTPIFEPPDEVYHFPLIDHLARTGALPVQDPDDVGPWEQEGSQPPLYYLLSAPLVLPLDRGDLTTRLARNPHAKIGIGAATDNHVSVLHDWDAEAFPWRGTARAVHVVRLFSVALGAGTIAAIYAIARLALPGRPALHITATLLAAFNPMFLFISSSVNNDNLVNLLSATTLALLLDIWRAGLSTRRVVALAALLALASLAKLSGLALYPVAALAVLGVLVRERHPWAEWARTLLIVIAAWAVIAGWWYARNIHLYGEPFGLNSMIEIIGPRERTPTWGELAGEFEGLRRSTWGVFGTLNLSAPDALFWYGDALSLIALIGLAILAIRTRASASVDWRALGLLALHALIVFVALVNWTRRTPATQGRLLFPALGGIVTLAALGWGSWLPRKWERFAPLAAAPLVAAAITLPFAVIRPAYSPPPTVADLPADAVPVDARFGPIELLGVRVANEPIAPDEALDVTLYWRPTAHTTEDMSLYAQVFGHALPDDSSALAEIGKVDSYPGGGLLRTTTWALDRIYADRYLIPIADGVKTPVQPAIKIGWRHFGSGEEFSPETRSGVPLDAVIVNMGRVAGEGARLSGGEPVGAVFGGVMQLNAVRVAPVTPQPGESLTVDLEWEALAPVGEDFTVLVHLVDLAQPEQPLAQGDDEPLSGRWPTSSWIAGHTFVDPHAVALPADLPPGEYALAVGFYRPADFTRLPVETERATLPGAVILPQTVTVEGS